MRLLYTLLCLLPLALFAQLDEPAIIAATQTTAAGGTCPGSPSQESDQSSQFYRMGTFEGSARAGQAGWNDGGTPRTICGVEFKIGDLDGGGDVSGKHYTAYIYDYNSGTEQFTTLRATSDTITGVTMGNVWLHFTFSPAFTTTGSAQYAIVFGPDEATTLDNYFWAVSWDTDVIPGHGNIFTVGGAPNYGSGQAQVMAGLDHAIRLYFQ